MKWCLGAVIHRLSNSICLCLKFTLDKTFITESVSVQKHQNNTWNAVNFLGI